MYLITLMEIKNNHHFCKIPAIVKMWLVSFKSPHILFIDKPRQEDGYGQFNIDIEG